jgi:CheY-like chemotaxis protein
VPTRRRRAGSEVLDELRGDPKTADVPIAVVSADATAVETRRLRDKGADDYVTKPLDVTQFLASLERALSRWTMEYRARPLRHYW